MQNPLELAKSSILDPSGLDESHLSQAFSTLLNSSADSGDIYFQLRKHEAWSLEDGIVKDASYNINQGVGIRAIKGDKSGFAYSDEIVLPSLLESCKAARSIASGNQTGQVQAWKSNTGHQLYLPDNPLDSMTETDKVSLLQSLDTLARKQDHRIKQVMASIAGTHEVILVANSDGSMAADVRPLVRLNVSVIVEENGRLEQGSAGGGGRVAYDFFTQEGRAESYVHEAVRMALLNLDAVDAPAGEMNVVLGPGWPGVLLHEAIGASTASRLSSAIRTASCT
ncbi:MAG: DNA gyrase modulator [Pseudomonadota bacterium]